MILYIEFHEGKYILYLTFLSLTVKPASTKRKEMLNLK